MKISRKHSYVTKWKPEFEYNGFSGVAIKDQPNHDLYKIRPVPAQWWMDGFKASIAIPAYINVGLKNGFGLFNPSVNNKRMPKWLDRSSPLIWI